MILVTGANGHLGKATIEFLIKKINPGQIFGMVRDPQKAEDLNTKGIVVRQGDYFDYNSLTKAFKGINKLLFISSGTVDDRIKQHKKVIDAAKELGVKHILYTSMLNTSSSPYFIPGKDHFETEKYLKSSGITYTILRNAYYIDVLPMFIGEALTTGKIYYPAGEGRVSFTARVDMAEATANILVNQGHENKIYPFGVNTSYSFQDIAKALSELANKQIDYVDIPLETMRQELLKKKTPEFLVNMLTQLAESFKHNEGNYPDPTLENLLGRKPVGLKEFLKNTYLPVEQLV